MSDASTVEPAAQPPRHREAHRGGAAGWLRAAVLGSNDAIVSTAGLLMGVAASHVATPVVLTTGVAGLVAGALSMAVGEYVSVSSQRDAENADIARERRELAASPELELDELTRIYIDRGLDANLARQVAVQLTAGDAEKAHLRDELGIEAHLRARPVQAAWVSAASFAVFALIPVLAIALVPSAWQVGSLAAVTLASLATLGALGARIAGAPVSRVVLRVVSGGALALIATYAIGRLAGTTLG